MGWLAGRLAWLADGENWQGADGVPQRLLEHIGLSAAAVGIACLLALPLGLWLGHVRRGGAFAVATGNLARAVPTFAVLVLLALAPYPFGLGTTSTLTALVLFAIPPMLTNAYVGVLEVDPAAVDAARGMGLTASQVLAKVELPLAVPLAHERRPAGGRAGRRHRDDRGARRRRRPRRGSSSRDSAGRTSRSSSPGPSSCWSSRSPSRAGWSSSSAGSTRCAGAPARRSACGVSDCDGHRGCGGAVPAGAAPGAGDGAVRP